MSNSRSATASNVKKLSVQAKGSGDTADLSNGLINLMYTESILQDAIRCSVTFVDTGNAIDGAEGKTAVEGLPIEGGEEVTIRVEDVNGETLNLTLDVNKVTNLVSETNKSQHQLNLVSPEFELNEEVRINERMDGRVSDHIRKILTDQNYLATEKEVDIEETSNNYNFIGNNTKPYYALNWLSKTAVSAENQKKGKSAGYFFFETSEGFKFKSIDGLLSQKQKKSIIYTQTADDVAGYDTKALQFNKDNSVDVQKKKAAGAFSTRTILFDPFNCYYEVVKPNSQEIEKEDGIKTAGKRLPDVRKDPNKRSPKKEFTRTTYYLIDRGTLPSGTTNQQLSKSREQNFDPKNILNQAIMRYNQLYSSKVTITIAGDFSLHAGDVVFVDAPGVESSPKKEEVDKKNGGLYIIADLCHLVTPKETYTKLNLVRDSFGRKGNHTSRPPL
jgi:hypothetical protein